MSLLMQALRKAERARAKDRHGQQPAEPQFGQDAVPSAPPMEGGPAFAVMPDAWRLEPLDAAPPVIPAQEAAHDPVPPQARHEPLRAQTRDAAADAPFAGVGGDDVGASSGAGSGARAGTGIGAGAALGTGLGWQSNERGGAEAAYAAPAGAVRAGAHPPAPARAIASSQRRLVVLAGTLAGLLAVFAFIYWRALSGPGPGARLPKVPMPGPGAAQVAQSGAPAGVGIPVAPSAATTDGVSAAAGSGAAAVGGGAAAVGGGAAAVGGGAAAVGGGAAAVGGGAAAADGSAALGDVGADAAAGAPGGGGAVLGAVAGLAAVGDIAPTLTTAAPATRPKVDVTIPTPEQLAAIPDPAIRAEAMRDAAERAARQARNDTVPAPAARASPQYAEPAIGPAASTGAAGGMDAALGGADAALGGLGGAAGAAAVRGGRAARSRDTGVAAGVAAPRGTTAPGTRASRQARRTGGEAGNVRANGVDGAGAIPGGRTITTAVGENGDVRFVRGVPPAGISPAVQNGYNALKAGDLATARQQYDLALLQDPNNRDALLGAAAVALREHDGRQASSNYLRMLELNPKDPEAVAGLAELRPGDLENNEVKLKGLARQHPDSGPVQFALGNLLARQGRWPEAQQSYFRAFSAMPDNADYAYNLGIGLDHMNQPRLASDYYRRALELAQTSPPTFNIEAVRKRLQVLETPPR